MAVAIPAGVYVLLSLAPVSDAIGREAEAQLSALLGADVSVGRISIHPFRRVSIRDISATLNGDTIASIATVSAGIEVFPLITQGKIVIDYALIDGLNLKVCRPAPGEPLNIEPVIERLKGKDNGEKKKIDLEISTAIVRRASASYDVLSVPQPEENIFCPDHIRIENLAINAFIPEITEKDYHVSLDHLSFDERSGFCVEKLTGRLAFTPEQLTVSNLSISLPHSRIAFLPLGIDYASSNLKERLHDKRITIATEEGCNIYPPDLSAFVPMLAAFDSEIEFSLAANASMTSAEIERLEIADRTRGSFTATISGSASGLDNRDSLAYIISQSTININGTETAALLRKTIPGNKTAVLGLLPVISLKLTGNGTASTGKVHLLSDGSAGKIDATASYLASGKTLRIKGDAALSSFNLGLLSGNGKFGYIDAKADANVLLNGKKIAEAITTVNISRLDFNNYSYSGIKASLDYGKDDKAEFSLIVNDPAADIRAFGFYNNGENPSLYATALANGIDLARLGLYNKRPDDLLSAKLNAEITDFDPRNLKADIFLNDISWMNRQGKGLKINSLSAKATNNGYENSLTIDSPYLSGELRGKYDFGSVASLMKAMASHFVPALESDNMDKKKSVAETTYPNKFFFDFDIKPSTDISEFLNLPFAIVYNGNISGQVDSESQYANVRLDVPYISQGNKLIEHTSVFAELDVPSDRSLIYATTQMPTKKGDMNLAAAITAKDNRIDTRLEWGLDRRIPINGTVDVSATLNSFIHEPGVLFPVDATIDFLPGTLNFGDDTWKIERSQIGISENAVQIDDFALDTGKQRIEINGRAGINPDDIVNVSLNDIRLIHIFENLEIDNVLIDGKATGRISASNLFSKEPILECPRLHVDSIGYNQCYFGDADITAAWNTENRAIHLDAGIDGFGGKKSHIYGDIFPLGEALDLNFDADSIPVGFLRPFMSAFTSSITGAASGTCRLFGTFHDMDLEGDIFADNVKIKVDFTNVTYTARDSVLIRPGRINLDNITIRDPEGHTAKLNGYVNHTFFRAPVFRFNITDARGLLSYNTTARNNPDWYGIIYGNGSATVSGRPGVVDIGVDMSTAPRSAFTFVLSDRLDAEDYSFLNFRDVTPDSLKAPVNDNDPTPGIIREMKKKLGNITDESSSDYNMDIRVTATPDTRMTLVVDPVSGDEIKAVGNGSLHMVYRSANNDLNMWGKYTVNDGKYRFTLQDIIIKDFTIKEGSEIRFDGDPYAVKTDISAYYATNANLTDLDDSFGQDKEVARTNVPVHAVMNVTGDIRQPSIDFDFEFPTLTSDTYRKVRSIVSTPDMMNRQIIYLLALNRFYTPDYMSRTTKGSDELFSVASSTISNQLGNMLGKLSDNWSIAPNLRSDRGDFSDVEVDVALSSRLLNNRLLFNGNFGYRDNTLNNDQFIGDFDIEYLLNRSGTWRLKAYNRYNDRNYYVRSALTTQGVGIMFRRDFDSMLSFLRKKKKKTDTAEKTQPARADSVSRSAALPVKKLHTDSIK